MYNLSNAKTEHSLSVETLSFKLTWSSGEFLDSLNVDVNPYVFIFALWAWKAEIVEIWEFFVVYGKPIEARN